MTLARYKMQNYLKEIFLDSDTKVALLSGAPFEDPAWWLMSNAQIAAARNSINKIAGSRRSARSFRVHPQLSELDGRGGAWHQGAEAR